MMAGMMPFGYGHYAQQLVYYPPAAGMGGLGPYQQPPMPAPGGQWPPHPSSGSSSGPRRQGAGGPGPAGPMQLGPAGGSGGSYPGMPSGPAQFGYYPGGAAAPHTSAVAGSHQRQSGMGRAGSSSSGGTNSTGWGGVPLSQSAAEVLASAVPSPRTAPAVRTPSGSLELPAATSLGVAASPEAGEATGLSSAPVVQAAAAAAVRPAVLSQHAGAAEQPGEGESASQAGPSSSSSDGEEGGERQQRASSLAASSSSGGDGGKGGRNGSSSGGSSGGSRRSRGSRDRGQQPCAFFLKTGTCAYGDK